MGPLNKKTILEKYEKHEVKFDISFFIAGFLFDVFTLSEIDDPLSLLQQVVYFIVIGSIIFYDFLDSLQLVQIPTRLNKIWSFRHPILHFFMGSLLSVYSLFFLKSSSFFSSLIFVVLILLIMIGNEIKKIQEKADLKIGLFVTCLFSFFLMIVPVLLGFVGWTPFFISVALTFLVVYLFSRALSVKIKDPAFVHRKWTLPSVTVIVVFIAFYFVGWIPPVPLSVQNMGVYHSIEKNQGNYILSHEKPWWKFWKKADQDFKAEPGDKIFFFAQVFSPGRFDDSVILHWYQKDPKMGWVSSDKISMRVTGGRKNGYRGYAVKQNYTPGEWRVSVETTDSREIGRYYFDVESVATKNPQRVFEKVIY